VGQGRRGRGPAISVCSPFAVGPRSLCSLVPPYHRSHAERRMLWNVAHACASG